MNRRKFIESSVLLSAFFTIGGRTFLYAGEGFLQSISQNAEEYQWNKLPIGEIITLVGEELLGNPYVGGILDVSNTEKCVVNLDELDCVTFFEQSLAIARLIKKNDLSYESLIKEVTLTRYRNGNLNGYTSRLHYTSDWIYDNVKKRVINDITKELDGKKIRFNLSFMSKNPKYYKQLKNNPGLTGEMSKIENVINARDYYYIPIKNIREIENELQSGDIIALVTSKEGLDYSHTGLINKKDGTAHFMHASSKKKKVVLDVRISEYASQVASNVGISVLRPIEPANG
jgi:hypothetical protein